MTFYARILELHPEYEGMRAADLAAQGMGLPGGAQRGTAGK